MMITIKCDGCETRFSVEEQYIKNNKVKIPFHCPYCVIPFPLQYRVRIREVSGGVNISGADNLHIGGDVVGGDLIKKY
jgi:hypothetical protein